MARPVRTVPVDGEQIRKLRLERNWKQETLATEAVIGLRTVQRAEASAPIEPHFLKSIADALEVPVAMLLPQDASGIAPAESKPDVTKPHNSLTITLEGPFSPEMQRQAQEDNVDKRVIVGLAAVELLRNPAIRCDTLFRSIIIRFDCTSDDAQRILEAFKNGELDYLGISNIEVGPPFHSGLPYLRPARAQRLLGLGGVLLGGGASTYFLFPQLPWIGAVALAGAGGLAGIAGLFLSWRRKRGYLLPGLALLLNALLLAWLLTRELPPGPAPAPAVPPAGKRLEFTANKFTATVPGHDIRIQFGTHTTLREVWEDEDGTLTLYLPAATFASGCKVERVDPSRLTFLYRYTEQGEEKTIIPTSKARGDGVDVPEKLTEHEGPGTYIIKVAPRKNP